MKNLIVVTLAALAVCVSGTPARNLWFGKVLGGEPANPGEFPHMVSLRMYGGHNCGGSIISKNYVLTAAHCIVGANPRSIVVVAGTNKLNSGGNNYNVTEVITHKDYKPSDSWRNDVGLLKLSTSITFNTLEQAVPLPKQDEEPADQETIVSGWGYTEYPPTGLPNDLQKVKLMLVSNDDCNAKHSIPVYPTHICAGTINGEGVCNGDSGSALLSDGTQVGIVSWGRPCAIGYPDVYTRVASYADWISQNAV